MTGERTDLGSGHSFTWLVGNEGTWEDPWSAKQEQYGTEHFPVGICRSEDTYDHARMLVLTGIIETHVGADGEECSGVVNFVSTVSPSEHPRPKWEVKSLVPLDISPSLQCTREGCGSHGFIHDGLWEAA